MDLFFVGWNETFMTTYVSNLFREMPFEGFGFSRMGIGKGRGYLPPPDKKLLALVIALHNLTIKNTQYLHTYLPTYLSK